ncbi:hypothetical protein ACFOOM_13840 [Streptomyces echinoruber]|uniref:Secreted protein n=1 Tax=Streptomyces echinoruber TaxID=68898 RepID=A0A918RER6_9ACTN|nr:hypothetical protein [Streptomyces echinoruber]GGZ95203.1 hypothetical protein GCM10010389_37700 [Streptomyces echinoruber]
MRLGVRRAAATTTAVALIVLSLGSGVAVADDVPADTGVVINTDPPQETDPADTGLVDVPADRFDAEPDIPGGDDTGPGNHPGGDLCDRTAVSTPAHKTTHAPYGVYRLRNQGTSYLLYSNFRTSAKSTVTGCTPHHVGWYIWETSN